MMELNRIVNDYNNAFPGSPRPLVARAPGRINIIGEHTDYNDGFVLPAAIDKAAYVAISFRDDNEVHLFAKDLGETFSICLEDLGPVISLTWPNYLLGPLAQFGKKGIALRGFNAMLTSNVPVGAGLSSSAAIECAISFALNHLFQSDFDAMTLITMAQKAEHEYAGVLCGIMDQFASVMGRKDHVMQLDCRSLGFTYFPFKPGNIKILLLNTNVKHSLASSQYNMRRNECSQAVQWISEYLPGIKSLRDVTEEMLDRYVLPKDKLIDQRSRFVVREIQRLVNACNDLQSGDFTSLGKKMFVTHDELSRLYDVSCRELDWLVDFVRHDAGVIGARMIGGGFGGCTINLVKEDAVDALLDKIKPAYEREMNLPLDHYIMSIENGAEIVALEQYAHV